MLQVFTIPTNLRQLLKVAPRFTESHSQRHANVQATVEVYLNSSFVSLSLQPHLQAIWAVFPWLSRTHACCVAFVLIYLSNPEGVNQIFPLFFYLRQISQLPFIPGRGDCRAPTQCHLICLNFLFDCFCVSAPPPCEYRYHADADCLKLKRLNAGFRIMKDAFMFHQANDPNFTLICNI